MKKITFLSRGQTVTGYAHIPGQQMKAPAIVMCHGFTGDCMEHGLFVDFAKQAAAQGFYVIRIDCLGSGESTLDFAQYTHLRGWEADILSALAFAAQQPEVDPKRMATMGISMGAAAAILAGQSRSVRAVVGWAPVLYPKQTFGKILGEKNWKQLENGENIHHEYAGCGFDAAPQFIKDLEELSVECAIRNYGDKPLLLRQGSADPVIDITHAPQIAERMGANVVYQPVEGEDHGFMIHKQDHFDATLKFLRKHLMGEE